MDAYLRLLAQQDQLEQLQGDLKDAIEAYRAVIRKPEFPAYL
jgi:hypothetical protein